MNEPTRPALRFHGGKWLLAKWIISHFPAHRVYVEPYGGAASVLLQKPRAYAEVYNDLDGEVVNLFKVLRSPAQARELIRLLALTPFARAEFELSYITADDPIEQARRTVIRSFMGVGSNALNRSTGFRSNSNRSGTTPARDWRNYPDNVLALTERLQGVVIENRPALEVISQHDQARALHYIDPPYVHDTRQDGNLKNYRFEMDDQQHRDLAAALQAVKGMVIVSGYRCGLYDELYQGWQRIDREAHADGARKRIESLWLSPRTVDALGAGSMTGGLFDYAEAK